MSEAISIRRIAVPVERAGRSGDRVLSVYRDHGVVPKDSRSDNFNKTPDDLSRYQRVGSGDLVVNKMKAWSGSIAVSRFEGIVSPDYLVCSLSNRVAPRYIHHVLRSPQLIGEMGMRSKGIRPNQERLYWDDLAEIRIRVPGLDEQRQIADFLDDQVARIDALGTLRERQSELLLWQLHSARVEASLQVSQWVAPLRRATTCLDGRRIPVNAQERASMSGPYPYWGAGSIVDHVDRWLFDEPLVLLGEDGAPFFDPLRDVAFSVTGKIWVNNHIHVLRPLASHRPGYLGHMLNCVDYSSYITGSTRDKLTQDQMMSIRLPLPAPEAQLGIERSLDDFALEVASRRESLSRSSQLLGELKRSLISATVSGEFDVSAASGWGVRL